MNIPDYRIMKNAIIKNCVPWKESFTLNFKVDYKCLEEAVKGMKLRPLPIMMESQKVKKEDVLVLSEYLKGQNLSWLDNDKDYMIIPFIDTDSIDERCQHLIHKLFAHESDHPDIDKVKALSDILANYPCFNAAIISYISSDPNRYGKATFEIKVRSNTVAIKLMDARNHTPNIE